MQKITIVKKQAIFSLGPGFNDQGCCPCKAKAVGGFAGVIIMRQNVDMQIRGGQKAQVDQVFIGDRGRGRGLSGVGCVRGRGWRVNRAGGAVCVQKSYFRVKGPCATCSGQTYNAGPHRAARAKGKIMRERGCKYFPAGLHFGPGVVRLCQFARGMS